MTLSKHASNNFVRRFTDYYSPENGPWFPLEYKTGWCVTRLDWQEAQRPPIYGLVSKREADSVAVALNGVWSLEAGAM